MDIETELRSFLRATQRVDKLNSKTALLAVDCLTYVIRYCNHFLYHTIWTLLRSAICRFVFVIPLVSIKPKIPVHCADDTVCI